MKKNERFTPPLDHCNTTGRFNLFGHGFDGINTVSLSGFTTSIDSRGIEITTQLVEYPFNLDMNSGYPLGIDWKQQTPIARPNLHVLPHPNTMMRKEVILSAGTIGTPNTLIHSGIGNSTTLASIGIKLVYNLPLVGQNLSDYTVAFSSFLVNLNHTYETAERNAAFAAEQLAQWETTRTGPLVNALRGQLGWLRIPDNYSMFERFLDPAAGPNPAYYELLFANGILHVPRELFQHNHRCHFPHFLRLGDGRKEGRMYYCRGPNKEQANTVPTVNGSNTLSDPLIDPNHLDSEIDL
ncbi:Aryl-alcohol oxidase [Mycena venus]|uniref:Aryl-alcohol oxidase n=1 Tax=Mycena venus TaxID=2733690 RepID=A0A8H6WTN7_9AGAR|nr:Aryl-alcohol oxidase [Mycena venus]